ncbi:4Fe-4S dicluster domain-containing protein [Sulfurimonas lithotrophica]|uniref:4Fe-4S dicluster domain-containing protein n=1 Tax=Sulfurimonas lithotrophica TaxID=2590022 RepID=A0A5P8P381_9BACT|nr:2Fe-2S iron-sulfur cluster-binding protein [Sulfurimonas lithotrophica]QFR50116.1 4Fe-4S dicluster domain-containing protein [Sulfurimonas lithotrophica]
MIKFKINGTEFSANKGETILEVARANGIYIPTMCYLPKATPSASCRMCSVEVEGQEGFVLSCNTPPVEGIEVRTDSDALYKERQNIMKMYNVNHPLQCGVCDKSGECELQNKTLEFGVAEQNFAVRDQSRKKKKWGVHTYDPALCILCEKCTVVCNETVGNEALFIKPGGYKSHIDINLANCIQCGECISVCPVGAMASTEFKYSSNAWELKQVPSSCSHCSSACSLNYEVKEGTVRRVTNEFEFSSLCGGGRFGFDFENRVLNKDEDSFADAVENFKIAKNVIFTSNITNEEAYLLNELKKKFGFNLVNDEAKKFQEFMESFSSTANISQYNATLKDVSGSDFIVSVGCSIQSDNPMVKFAMSQAVKYNKAYVSTIHPIEETPIANVISQYIKNEVGSEEAALAMLADMLVEDKSSQEEFFDSLDLGYLSGESNISEEELDVLKLKYARVKKPVLVLGEDVINHPRSANIAAIAGYLQKNEIFKVLIIPTLTNTLGVSMICDLDKAQEGLSIGYNVKADYTLSAKSEGDLDMPALNQQEGTFVNIDKDLVVLNAAADYEGYELNDIANALGLKAENVIEYTSKLGFKEIDFDDLDNYYDNVGNAHRGYRIEPVKNRKRPKLQEVDDLAEYNGSVVYSRNPLSHFNVFTKDCKQLKDKPDLIGSEQFAIAAKIKSGDNVRFSVDGVEFTRHFKVDRRMKGTVAYNPTFDVDAKSASYRYTQVKLEVINE